MHLLLAAFLIAGQAAVTAPPEPPASQESAQLPRDVRLIAIVQARGAKPRALVDLRGGARLQLSVGDALGRATVTDISLDDASLTLRETLDEPRLLEPWRDIKLHEWSGMPAIDGGDDATCPSALARVEGNLAVFRFAHSGGAPVFKRLAAGAPLCGGLRVARVSPSAGTHGVVILENPRSGGRVALASWRP